MLGIFWSSRFCIALSQGYNLFSSRQSSLPALSLSAVQLQELSSGCSHLHAFTICLQGLVSANSKLPTQIACLTDISRSTVPEVGLHFCWRLQNCFLLGLPSFLRLQMCLLIFAQEFKNLQFKYSLAVISRMWFWIRKKKVLKSSDANLCFFFVILLDLGISSQSVSHLALQWSS